MKDNIFLLPSKLPNDFSFNCFRYNPYYPDFFERVNP